jgi:aspartate/glutamate racemase
MSKKILDMVDALQGMSAEARVLASNTTHEAISDG